MSAFMVDKVHIDLLVKTAIHGPRQMEGHWEPIRWFDLDPVALRVMAEADANYFGSPFYRAHSRQAHPEDADRIGQMLVDENLRSIHARYPDTVDRPEGTPGPIVRYWEAPYTYTKHHYRLTVPEALQALRCYEYQSCEHEGWPASEAYQFCDALRAQLIAHLPGMDKAPWEWTPERLEEHRAARKASA